MAYSVDRLLSNSIPAGEVGLSVPDALQHLVACHERIEEHLQMLERVIPHLASASEAKRQEAREALGKALRFLEAMGHLHTRDEEDSLFPHLRAKIGEDPFALGELMLILETQHREKEAVFAKLLSHVGSFPAAPEAPTAEQVSRLEGWVDQLTGLYQPHIMIENERLIPLSRECLKESDLEQMRQEMRDRRGS